MAARPPGEALAGTASAARGGGSEASLLQRGSTAQGQRSYDAASSVPAGAGVGLDEEDEEEFVEGAGHQHDNQRHLQKTCCVSGCIGVAGHTAWAVQSPQTMLHAAGAG